MYTKFITKKPISLSLLITCLTLDTFIILGFHFNGETIQNKPNYTVGKNDDQAFYIYKDNYEGQCQTVDQFDLSYLGQYSNEKDFSQQITRRISRLNDIDLDLFNYLNNVVTIFYMVTSYGPLSADFILTIADFWNDRIKNTKKISLIRNIMVLNWILMQPLMLLSTIINNINYKECFYPQDLSLLIHFYTDIRYMSLFIVMIVIDIYFSLFMMVQRKNEMPCIFLLFILFHSLVCYTILIYNAGISSKKLIFFFFIYKQWAFIFEIQKLYLEFYVIQYKHNNLRLQEAKFNK